MITFFAFATAAGKLVISVLLIALSITQYQVNKQKIERGEEVGSRPIYSKIWFQRSLVVVGFIAALVTALAGLSSLLSVFQ